MRARSSFSASFVKSQTYAILFHMEDVLLSLCTLVGMLSDPGAALELHVLRAF